MLAVISRNKHDEALRELLLQLAIADALGAGGGIVRGVSNGAGGVGPGGGLPSRCTQRRPRSRVVVSRSRIATTS